MTYEAAGKGNSVANFTADLFPFRPSATGPLRSFCVPAGIVGPIVAILDLVCLFAAMALARRLYDGPSDEMDTYLGLGFVAGLTFLLCSGFWKLHRSSCLLNPLNSLGFVGLSAAFGIGSVVIFLFLLKIGGEYSRGILLLSAFLAPLTVVFERLLVGMVLRRAVEADVIRGKRVLIIGYAEELEHLTNEETVLFGLDEVGRVKLPISKDGNGLSESDKSLVMQAIKYARSCKASEYSLLIPWSHDQSISQIVDLLRSSPRAIRLYPDHKTRAILSQKRKGPYDSHFSVEIQPEPLSIIDRAAKRGFDIAVAVLGLALLTPILGVVALMIKLDSSGPVFFRQTRRGFDDHEFKIWKFRTMTVMEDGPHVAQAQRCDRRVTRMGRILRRTSVDELPQLINVIRGEMSIVGPRPHAVAHDQAYGDLIAEYALRRHVKPGLTGFAQVNGFRGETKTPKQMEMRVEKDLWYINNWSLWLDAKIALQTLFVLAINEAY